MENRERVRVQRVNIPRGVVGPVRFTFVYDPAFYVDELAFERANDSTAIDPFTQGTIDALRGPHADAGRLRLEVDMTLREAIEDELFIVAYGGAGRPCL